MLRKIFKKFKYEEYKFYKPKCVSNIAIEELKKPDVIF